MISTKRLVSIGIFTALMIVSVFVKITLGPVPFTLQTLIALMAGIVLGKRDGAIAMLIYTIIGLIGLPVFSGGGGPGYVLAPTFGFILGFILAAFVSGLLYEKLKIANKYLKGILSTIIGALIVYLPGLIYFYLIMNNVVGKPFTIFGAISVAMLPFLIPDLVKGIIAGILGVIINNALFNRQLKDKE